MVVSDYLKREMVLFGPRGRGGLGEDPLQAVNAVHQIRLANQSGTVANLSATEGESRRGHAFRRVGAHDSVHGAALPHCQSSAYELGYCGPRLEFIELAFLKLG